MPIRMDCPSCGQKLQVPDTAAGKRVKCPGCEAVLDVANTGVTDAESFDFTESRPAPYSVPAYSGGGDSDRRPCPMCGEMIATAAAKCRFCGEIFDPELRALDRKKNVSREDTEMTGVEWFFTVVPICNVGCILGIVYLIQGKPKGSKILGLSVLFIFMWYVVIGAIGAIVTALDQ